MYAEHRYQPQQSRAVSIGASLLISGAIITGMIYSAPNIIKHIAPTFEATQIPLDPVPPPDIKPIEKPKVAAKTPTQPPITAPDPVLKTDSNVTLKTTPDIPPVQPDIAKPVEAGRPVTVDPPKPAPALVGARRDPRYADAFQPNYPASELRAQRDGRVSVRVLVGPDGRVKAVEQVSATSAAFFEATKQQALSKWRFKPATRGGVAEESWMTLSVTFQIKDQ
ncbi:protein TonB [Sphingomonas leidyi]|uniref:Protein TonB n=1 Tax=Sphingomonas leidyi TaxID=68569 RepID=A0A7X5V1P8_9SPHN|nr:TonB family protein [Sphingomonas leidyi]NIJ65761.1 protein TonB [Sphingomonas leidyi]